MVVKERPEEPSRRPCGRERRDLGERRGHGARQRRGPADGARGALPEPGVDARAVEQVAAVGEHPDHVAVAVVVEVDGAARLLPLLLPPRLPRLRVRHLRERLERGLVDAPLDAGTQHPS